MRWHVALLWCVGMVMADHPTGAIEIPVWTEAGQAVGSLVLNPGESAHHVSGVCRADNG
jgi:hypothetical protein